MDFIDGSYAVRAASAGAALLLRESDRGQAGQQRVDDADTTHCAVSQPAPISPRMTPRHPGQLWRRASRKAAVQKEHSSEKPEDHASASQERTIVQDSRPGSVTVAPYVTEHRPSFVAEDGTRGKSSRSPDTAEEWDLDDTNISLHSERFRRDSGPLSQGCPCHACLRHTRAYIHHLLNVNEMLAEVRETLNTCCQFIVGVSMFWSQHDGVTGCLHILQVLLEIHNSRNYLDFFADARQAISAGKFVEFRQGFLNRRSLRYSHAA